MFLTLLTYVLYAILALWAWTAIVVTPQQTTRMITTFGRHARATRPGISLKMPWPVQAASAPFSLRLMQSEVEVSSKTTNDALVIVPIRVKYMVDFRSAKEAFYLLENAEEQIQSYVVNQIRATVSKGTLDDLFEARDTMSEAVRETLDTKMAEFGYIIRDVLVDDPQPSEKVRDAIDQVLASERLREAAKNEAEAARIKKVADAEAEKQSMVLRAEAISDFRNTITEGNATAINKFVSDTGLTSKDALQFIISINEMEGMVRASEAGGSMVYISGSAQKSDIDPVAASLAGRKA